MTIRIHKNLKYWLAVVVFYLLLFQNALEELFGLFRYIDELIPLIGIAIYLYRTEQIGKIMMSRKNGQIVLWLLVFFLVGVLGNLIYRYQPVSAVVTDIYTNFKFFLAMITGYYLLYDIDDWSGRCGLVFHAKCMAVLFLILLLADQFLDIFDSYGTRYGLRVTKLFFSHPTYLAGSMVYLIAILTLFLDKKNYPYIIMSLIVLFFTLRGKAIGGVVVYMLLFYFLIVYRSKLKLWHFGLIAVAALIVAGDQFSYYYLELEGESARSALTLTSIEIMKDYFPIGTGFGTYASAQAAEYYSPVYMKYGLYNVHGLSENRASFASDTFWPIIFGQTGVIGTICFVLVIGMLFVRILRVRSVSIPAYATGVFIFAYLMISTTSEPAFHNSISIPLAILLGYILSLENKAKRGVT